MRPLRGLVGETSVSMSSSFKAPYLLCVLMGSYRLLSFAFGTDIVSAGLGADLVSAGFG